MHQRVEKNIILNERIPGTLGTDFATYGNMLWKPEISIKRETENPQKNSAKATPSLKAIIQGICSKTQNAIKHSETCSQLVEQFSNGDSGISTVPVNAILEEANEMQLACFLIEVCDSIEKIALRHSHQIKFNKE